MNCKDVQKQIGALFGKGEFSLPEEMRLHVGRCPACASFAADLKSMQGVLDTHDFKVRPGELDDITFEKITAAASSAPERRSTPGFARFLRWAWVPAAASAAVLALMLLLRDPASTDSTYTGTELMDYTNHELVDEIAASDSLGAELLVSLAGDDDELTHAADELLSGADLDDLLDGLTSDELKTLYSKLDDLKG